MKQITEDFVSFEVAKLLKEKGFDIPTKDFYDTTGENLKDSKTIYGGIPDFGEVNWNADQFICAGFPMLITFSRPSQSLALKWLREMHKINIVIGVTSNDDNLYSLWKFDIWNGNYSIIWGNKREKFNSYEQAVEAALKYTLENLI